MDKVNSTVRKTHPSSKRSIALKKGTCWLLSLLSFTLIPSNAETQEMKPAALTTKWAKEVDPTNPLPEYPRPQMVRSQWLSLNGIWQITSGSAGDQLPSEDSFKGKIVVPFPVESALSGVKAHFDRLWYRRTFVVPQGWSGKRILIHFGGVDFESELYVNGRSAGIHRGGYDAFSFDITDYLKAAGSQELIVRVYDPTEFGGQPRGKQSTDPQRILYTPTTGIWQTTWLEPVEPTSINSLKIVPDLDHAELRLTVNTTSKSGALPVEVVLKKRGVVVSTLRGASNQELRIRIRNPEFWSPDSPFLYDLQVTLNPSSRAADDVTSYFGMRKIEVKKVGSFNRILLNGKPFFAIGALDQGFWPDGIYTAPTDAALRNDIEMAKAFGLNTLRKHVKVEPDRWYYWADKLGVLVWQDMPSAVSYLNIQPIVRAQPLDKQEFESELRRMVELHWNHPSIGCWIIFNEGQGQFDTGRLVGEVHSLDPTRLIDEASGNEVTGAGDLSDVHSYPAPGIRAVTPTQALVDGEFGGIWEIVDGHAWRAHSDSYINATTPDDLLYLFDEYMLQAKQYRDVDGLAGVVYTQLTDVEQEMNGMLTYDRIPKVDPVRISRATRFDLPLPTFIPVVPTSVTSGQLWQYTTVSPSENWNTADFDDTSWPRGSGEFGNDSGGLGTSWTSDEIWLRRKFNPGELSQRQLTSLVADVKHVGYLQMYINGVLALSQDRNSPLFEHPGLTRQAREAIKLGADNVLAIHCKRRGPIQRVDAGLDLRVTVNPE